MIVLCDFDGVLNNITSVWVDCLNNEYGLSVTESDMTEYDITKWYKELTEEQIFRPLNEAWFWRAVQPSDGAVDFTKEVIGLGNDLYIVTKSNYKTIQVKYENMISVYFPHIEWKNIIVCNDKSMIRGDVIIDDWQDNLIGCYCNKILIDAPYNSSFCESRYNIVRAKSWADVMDEIDSVDRMIHADVGVRVR